MSKFGYNEIKKQIEDYPEAVEWNKRAIEQALKEKQIEDKQRAELLQMLLEKKGFPEQFSIIKDKIRLCNEMIKSNRLTGRADSATNLDFLFTKYYFQLGDECLYQLTLPANLTVKDHPNMLNFSIWECIKMSFQTRHTSLYHEILLKIYFALFKEFRSREQALLSIGCGFAMMWDPDTLLFNNIKHVEWGNTKSDLLKLIFSSDEGDVKGYLTFIKNTLIKKEVPLTEEEQKSIQLTEKEKARLNEILDLTRPFFSKVNGYDKEVEPWPEYKEFSINEAPKNLLLCFDLWHLIRSKSIKLSRHEDSMYLRIQVLNNNDIEMLNQLASNPKIIIGKEKEYLLLFSRLITRVLNKDPYIQDTKFNYDILVMLSDRAIKPISDYENDWAIMQLQSDNQETFKKGILGIICLVSNKALYDEVISKMLQHTEQNPELRVPVYDPYFRLVWPR